MNSKSWMLVAWSGIFALGCVSKWTHSSTERNLVIDLDKRAHGSQRKTRRLTLSNQLEVLLVSDPNFNKAAAALDVRVGSLQNPIEHQGLAHFLEHMLFLGTEKYPEVGEYDAYLQEYQGYSNAFTSDRNTNYYFEVNPQGFQGAVDRFSQFFISPRFDPKFVERELNAINSEHQKNIQSDSWRSMMVLHLLARKGHPTQMFSTGSSETLAHTSRDTLIDFYKKYYSANQMKLVLLAPESLDELEKTAREKFSPISNSKAPALHYEAPMFDPQDLPRLISIKPVKNLKRLSLVFEMPSATSYLHSKPLEIISHLLGHEGKGSLLSLLKKQNLATGLSTGFESESDWSTFYVDVSLTPAGLDKPFEVASAFFSYVQLLKQNGYADYIFQEKKNMSEIDYVYRDETEGGSLASHYAHEMHTFKSDNIDKEEFLLTEYSPKDFNLFLDYIRVDNVNLMWMNQKAKTNQKDAHFEAEYAVRPLTSEEKTQLTSVSVNPALHFPAPNEFIPKRLLQFPLSTQQTPTILLDEKWGTFWFQPDHRYELPKAMLQILFVANKKYNTALDNLLGVLYAKAFNETLNEWNYQITMAGLHYDLYRSDRGFQLSVEGYSENLLALVESVVQKLKTIDIDEKTFEVIKDDIKRGILNQAFDPAYKQTMAEIRYLLQPYAKHRLEYYNPDKKVDLISGITLAQVKEYAKGAYSELAIEGLGFGNLEPAQVKATLEKIPVLLQATAMAPEARIPVQITQIPVGKAYAKKIESKTDNSAYAMVVQMGSLDPKTEALLRIGSTKLSNDFYTELRTKQQLGYIVTTQLQRLENTQQLVFLIQSGDYDPYVLSQRTHTWLSGGVDLLKAMSDKDFERVKRSVAIKKREKEKTMEAYFAKVSYLALTLPGQFDYEESVAQAAEKSTKAEMIALFEKVFHAKTSARVAGYLPTGVAKEGKIPEEWIKNEVEFRKVKP